MACGCTRSYAVVGCSLAGATCSCPWLRDWIRTPSLAIKSSSVTVGWEYIGVMGD